LVIKNLADNYPNSGSLNKALNNFDKDLQNILTMKDKNLLCIRRGARKEIAKHLKKHLKKQLKKQSPALVSILTSIALKNPKIYSIFASEEFTISSE
jgi:hypothetical protein